MLVQEWKSMYIIRPCKLKVQHICQVDCILVGVYSQEYKLVPVKES